MKIIKRYSFNERKCVLRYYQLTYERNRKTIIKIITSCKPVKDIKKLIKKREILIDKLVAIYKDKTVIKKNNIYQKPKLLKKSIIRKINEYIKNGR